MRKILDYLQENKKKWLLPLIGLLVLAGWFIWYVYHWEHREPVLDVYFFAVTKGSAVFIRTPDNKTVLIGGGAGSDIIRYLTEVFPFYRRHIDTVIFSQDESNNIGLQDVLSRYDIGEILSASSTLMLAPGSYHNIGDSTIQLQNIGITATGTILRLSYGNASILLADTLSRKDQQLYAASSSLRGETTILQMRSLATAKVSSNFFEKIKPDYIITAKTPQRPKKIVATSTKKTKKTSTKSAKPIKPVKVKIVDPPFSVYNYRNTQLLGLDREGSVHFVSDGNSLVRIE